MLLGETNGGDGEIYGKQLDVTLSYSVFLPGHVFYSCETKQNRGMFASTSQKSISTRHVFSFRNYLFSFIPTSVTAPLFQLPAV